jgi:hypothetical protein
VTPAWEQPDQVRMRKEEGEEEELPARGALEQQVEMTSWIPQSNQPGQPEGTSDGEGGSEICHPLWAGTSSLAGLCLRRTVEARLPYR